MNFSLLLALVNVLSPVEKSFTSIYIYMYIERTNTDSLKIEDRKRATDVKCDTAIAVSKRARARH